MPYAFTDHETLSFVRAKEELNLKKDSVQGLCVVDYAGHADYENDKRLGLNPERYGVRDSRHVAIYRLIAVWGPTVEEDRRWYSPVGEFDDFLRPITDTVIDGKTAAGPWALMSVDSWRLQGAQTLGVGFGQSYRLRPDGVWIKYVVGSPSNLEG